jgi:hypothetical protein
MPQFTFNRHPLARGTQDARKGILFEGFPPVLQLQLKRFEYDFMKDMMVKVDCLLFLSSVHLFMGLLKAFSWVPASCLPAQALPSPPQSLAGGLCGSGSEEAVLAASLPSFYA